MYVIACHHLHYFLVDESKQSALRIQLRKQLLNLKNEASLFEGFSELTVFALSLIDCDGFCFQTLNLSLLQGKLPLDQS